MLNEMKYRYAARTSLRIVAVVFFLLISINLSAQQESVADLIKQGRDLSKEAYFQYNTNKMVEARSVLEKAYDMDKSNLLPLYYETLVDYKLLEMNMRQGGDSLFNKYYENALNNADTLSTNKDFSADGKILSSAIYMMKIAKSPMSAVTLSPKIHSLLDEAQSTNPDKPYSYVIRGMMFFNTPQMFGGSFESALKNFNQAAKLFENAGNENITNPDWGYAETLVWIGRTQEKLANNDAAKFAYQKALKVEPDYAWVKYSLLPSLEKK